eukprot:4562207-Prymnesium_polylepis.1
MRKLRRLHLADNSIGDKGALHLMEALRSAPPGLRLLNLSNNSVGDKSIALLARSLGAGGALSESLEELQLSANRVGDEGARALAAAITSGATKLRSLSLARNELTPGGEAKAELRRACKARGCPGARSAVEQGWAHGPRPRRPGGRRAAKRGWRTKC